MFKTKDIKLEKDKLECSTVGSTKKVLLKKLSENAKTPHYNNKYDAGLDLYTSEDTIIGPGKTVICKTGIAIELSNDLRAEVRPRSGNSANGVPAYKVAKSWDNDFTVSIANKDIGGNFENCRPYLRVILGTIDPEYRGEIGIITYNQEDYEVLLPKGTKLAQMVLELNVQAELFEVDELSDSARGLNGYGSSDK